MNIRDMIKQFLKENGYDGLCNCDNDCACLKDDIAPCGEICGDCFAGYYRKATEEEEYDFYIELKKPEKVE